MGKSDAREWLAGAECVFPFWLCCEFLDVDEDRLRRQIEKHVEKPSPALIEKLFAVPLGVVERRSASGGMVE